MSTYWADEYPAGQANSLSLDVRRQINICEHLLAHSISRLIQFASLRLSHQSEGNLDRRVLCVRSTQADQTCANNVNRLQFVFSVNWLPLHLSLSLSLALFLSISQYQR